MNEVVLMSKWLIITSFPLKVVCMVFLKSEPKHAVLASDLSVRQLKKIHVRQLLD